MKNAAKICEDMFSISNFNMLYEANNKVKNITKIPATFGHSFEMLRYKDKCEWEAFFLLVFLPDWFRWCKVLMCMQWRSEWEWWVHILCLMEEFFRQNLQIINFRSILFFDRFDFSYILQDFWAKCWTQRWRKSCRERKKCTIKCWLLPWEPHIFQQIWTVFLAIFHNFGSKSFWNFLKLKTSGNINNLKEITSIDSNAIKRKKIYLLKFKSSMNHIFFGILLSDTKRYLATWTFPSLSITKRNFHATLLWTNENHLLHPRNMLNSRSEAQTKQFREYVAVKLAPIFFFFHMREKRRKKKFHARFCFSWITKYKLFWVSYIEE